MWFTTSSDMQRDYYGSYIYTNEEGKQIAGDGYPRNLKEKGQYLVNFTSNMAYKEWKFRSITLKINIV